MNKIYDVIISGCGPSGSLLGHLLSQNNIDTLIIEKEFFPREKTCAGGIQHRALKLLPYDISMVLEKSIYGIYFSLRNKDVFLKKYDLPVIYTVQRALFDDLMASFASKSGCKIIYGEKIESFVVTDRLVDVFAIKNKNEKKKYSSRIVVGADGVRGMIRSSVLNGKVISKILGYETELPYKQKKTGKFDYTDCIRLDFGGVKKGYCWAFPKKKTISVGMGAPFDHPKKIKNYLRSFLAGFDPGSDLKIKAHGIPVRSKDTPFCGFRILTVGDAASLADGFTGEGLYNCFKSSIIAGECIRDALIGSDYRFIDYKDRINSEIFNDIKASLFFTRVFYGSLPVFYKLLKGDNNLFDSCCRILRGEKKYSDVLNRLKLFRTT